MSRFGTIQTMNSLQRPMFGTSIPLGNVSGRELPALVLVVQAREKPPRLLLLGDIEEELEDHGPGAGQMELVVADRLEALLPDRLQVDRPGELLPSEILRMDPHHQHLFVVAAVEDADAAALGQALRRPPEEIVIELLLGGRLEGEDLEARRIDTAHDGADGASR